MKEWGDFMNKIKLLLPGVLLCVVLILLSNWLADGFAVLLRSLGILSENSGSPVSGIFIAILIGIVIRNTIGLKQTFLTGVQFSMKVLLKAGIILLGLRLSLVEALKLGAWGIPLIISCITVGLVVTLYFTKKLNQSERLGTLTACGTGICGVTAIMATAPVIKAKDDEISYAVANITIFGIVSMFIYPFLAHFFFADEPVKAGLFLGTAIHDTAQVTGAALIYSESYQAEQVVDVATVTKLTRNLFIILIIPILSYLFYRKNTAEKATTKIPRWQDLVPLFVLGFLALSLLRTIGDVMLQNSGNAFWLFNEDVWQQLYGSVSTVSATFLLGAAMAGVGLSTDLKKLKGLGMKPFFIGLIAALSVSLVSFLLVYFFGHLISL